jgi:hypothetical protein
MVLQLVRAGPMWGRVTGIPIWLVVGVCSVPPIAYLLSLTTQIPVEAVLPTAVAMEVVFLSQTVQQALRKAEVRRQFGFALWELHQEMSQHLETLEGRVALVHESVNSELSRDALRTWASSVEAFPVEAWDRFLAVGGLHRLLDNAPDQIAANLYRYYDGVRTFNSEAGLRERVLEKLFNVTGPATSGIFKSVKASDKRLEAWLVEVPARLAVLMRDLQFVLEELAPKSGIPPSGQDRVRLASINERQLEEYNRWRQRHGDVAEPPEPVEWSRATQDEMAD